MQREIWSMRFFKILSFVLSFVPETSLRNELISDDVGVRVTVSKAT